MPGGAASAFERELPEMSNLREGVQVQITETKGKLPVHAPRVGGVDERSYRGKGVSSGRAARANQDGRQTAPVDPLLVARE